MTSVLNVDTIAAKDGTSRVALTKQEAAIVLFGMNTHSTTYMGIATNQVSPKNLNISSGEDGGTGKINGNLTTSLDTVSAIYPSGVIAANNTCTIDAGATTTGKIFCQMHDADSSSIGDRLGFMSVFGDLA